MKSTFSQGFEVCSPAGRDCIEKTALKDFGCNTTCEGIYAGVQWIAKQIELEMTNEDADEKDNQDDQLLNRLAELEREVKLLKNNAGEKGEELDKEKYKKLVIEYRKFKTSNVRHFRLNSEANISAFGEF